MNIKTVVLTIIAALLVGTGIFFLGIKTKIDPPLPPVPKISGNKTTEPPSPSPLPSLEPIDGKSDLNLEISNLEAPDFGQEYTALKEEVNTSF